jgi:AraC-like DNA-binding protein
MDGLTAVLRSLRLKSAFLSRGEFRGRWGVLGGPIRGKMIFHGVASGECYVRRVADGVTRHLQAGDVVVVTRGDAHCVSSEPGGHPTPIGDLPTRHENGLVVTSGLTGEETRVVCGTFTLDHPAHASLVELLPPLLIARPQAEARRRWSTATVALIEGELSSRGSSAETTALADSLFVSALAATVDEPAPAAGSDRPGAGAARSSLLAAARDERIGAALAKIHAEPSRAWSAAALAGEAAMSRTRFFDRFTELVGEPPAKYLARWRALVAADLLRQRNLSTSEIAERVGYADEDALAKVFKRTMGVTPAEYRRREAQH